jgi:hypothetical protein
MTDRGYIAFLAKGDRYGFLEVRSYRFSTDEEVDDVMSLRFLVNVDTKEPQDLSLAFHVPYNVPDQSWDGDAAPAAA